MKGLHLTGDLAGCRCTALLLTDPAALEACCVAAVESAGLRRVNQLFHAFAPGSGVTGVVLLAESHIAVHTWPEMAGVTLDVYVCNYGSDNSARARALFDALSAAFMPVGMQSHTLQRGGPA